MRLLIIIILSIVQGATEFIPISSSGHLVLLYRVFKIEENTIFLSVILHIATLCSILFVYRKELLQMIKKPFTSLTLKLFISTVITLILVLILLNKIEKSFSGINLAYGFIITAILLVLSETFSIMSNKKSNLSTSNIKLSITSTNINYKQAVFMGFAQGLAGFPGVSRSGSTIAIGQLFGEDKKGVANYSFLMSIPIILASLFFEIMKYSKNPTGLGFSVFDLIVGFIICFVMGVLCIKLMINFVSKQKLYIFAYYLVILSCFIFINDNYLFLF